MNNAEDPIGTFDQNVQAVVRLMNFDRDIQDLTIGHLEKLHESLVSVQRIQNEQLNGRRTLEILRGIRSNDSLRPRYQLIFNQAVVLLVSYFGSTLSSLFRLAVARAIAGSDKRVLSEDLTVEVAELLSRGDQIQEFLGDMLIQKKDISFQDMKSVGRAFKKYFGIAIEKTDHVNNIILGQACRHAIVHDGGRANARTLRQIENATPRTLKPQIDENEQISFTPTEVEQLASDMRMYAVDLYEKIQAYNAGLQIEAKHGYA